MNGVLGIALSSNHALTKRSPVELRNLERKGRCVSEP